MSSPPNALTTGWDRGDTMLPADERSSGLRFRLDGPHRGDPRVIGQSAMPIEVTIGIPTFDRDQVLCQTLEGVLAVADRATTEILVVDQTLEHVPEVQRRLAEWVGSGRLRVLRQASPSLTEARNWVLREARGRVVVFLDDDVLVPPGLFERHLSHYADPGAVAVAGEVYHWTNRTVTPSLGRPREGTSAHFGGRTGPPPDDEFVGCHHSVRRSAALGLGGYDDNYRGPANYEDSDMALRLTEVGRVVFDADAWVVHLRSPAGGCRIPNSKTWPEWQKSANYMLFAFRYWRIGRRARSALVASLRAGPLLRENVLRPWRWPAAWLAWGRAAAYGWRHRKRRQAPLCAVTT